MALLQPKLETYQRIARDPGASLARGVGWMCLSALAALVISLGLRLLFNPVLAGLLLGGAAASGGSLAAVTVLALCLTPLAGFFAALGLALSTVAVHLLARLYGGQGSFDRLFYTFAAFTAPAALLSALVGSIPFVSCLGILIPFYILGLQVLAVQAVYHFNPGRAFTVLMLPVLASFAVVCCLGIVLGAWAAPSLEGIIRQFMEQYVP